MRALAAALALLIAAPVAAQDRMTQPLCDGALGGIAALVPEGTLDATAQLDDEGWCRVAGARVDIDRATTLSIDAIRWRGTDMARFVDQGLPPRTFEIAVTGLRLLPQTGDPVYDYLLALQTQSGPGIGLAANLRWDGLQNALIIEQAAVTFDATNTVSITGRIDGVNLTDAASIQTSLGSAGLRDLLVKAEFNGWFETYVALTLGTALLNENDVAPAAQVEALKARVIGGIAGLPEGLLPAPTRDALSGFVTALPNPRGTAQLQITADPTIGAGRLLSLASLSATSTTPELVAAALEGVSLLFTWSPTER